MTLLLRWIVPGLVVVFSVMATAPGAGAEAREAVPHSVAES